LRVRQRNSRIETLSNGDGQRHERFALACRAFMGIIETHWCEMQRLFAVFTIITVVFFEFSAGPAVSGERVALVIGNGGYIIHDALRNPLNDAKAVSSALRRANFEVIEGYDLNRQDFEATLRRFLGEIDGGRVALQGRNPTDLP